jgi:D-alanyl-lipoteichoic acid acyltransferase DltB (MBOAT superfamily)
LLFNSPEYFVFFAVVFGLYWSVFRKSVRLQNLLLLAASYFFYGWWSVGFLGLLALSTCLDYLYGFGVASSSKGRAKMFLWLSVINNLGILAVFKYYDFFAVELKNALELFGLHANPILLNVALPIGISFYTFHGMSYVFDIYRKKQEPVKSVVDYAVFVSFFPLLVAGPIERANHLLPQIQRPRQFNYPQAVQGCRLILWGMFKKVVIADSLAFNVDAIFSNYEVHNASTLIIFVVAFSIQIYCDFSGYSDIALGTAKILGFELLSNFRFPYFSRDIAEFWRRWHVSLTSWFKDYLYIPLGGSKEGKLKAVRNTFIVFLVSGLWHGASWNFLIWGAIHAVGFMPLLLTDRNRRNLSEGVAAQSNFPSARELMQMFVTFAFVSFAWIFFRIPGLHDAIDFINTIITSAIHDPGQFFHRPKGLSEMLLIAILLAADWWLRRDERILRVPGPIQVRFLLYFILAEACVYAWMQHWAKQASQTFIYFQF